MTQSWQHRPENETLSSLLSKFRMTYVTLSAVLWYSSLIKSGCSTTERGDFGKKLWKIRNWSMAKLKSCLHAESLRRRLDTNLRIHVSQAVFSPFLLLIVAASTLYLELAFNICGFCDRVPAWVDLEDLVKVRSAKHLLHLIKSKLLHLLIHGLGGMAGS